MKRTEGLTYVVGDRVICSRFTGSAVESQLDHRTTRDSLCLLMEYVLLIYVFKGREGAMGEERRPGGG